MDLPATDVETLLIDLGDESFSVLRAYDIEVLNRSVAMIRNQVDRPRKNIGGGGPPGRAD